MTREAAAIEQMAIMIESLSAGACVDPFGHAARALDDLRSVE